MTLSITFYNNIKYSKDDFMNRADAQAVNW